MDELTADTKGGTVGVGVIFVALVSGCLQMASTLPAQADTLDQSFESNCSLTQSIWHNLDIAQTFTAGLDGWLTAIDVQLLVSGSLATDLYWEIQGTEPSPPPDTGVIPDGQVAASGTVPFASLVTGWQALSLPSPIQVINGEQIAIVLKTDIPFPAPTPSWCIALQPSTTYSGGDALRFGGVLWSPHNPAADHDFHTYVPEPSRLVQFIVSLSLILLLQLRAPFARFHARSTNTQSHRPCMEFK